MEIPAGQSRKQQRTLAELLERHHPGGARAGAHAWIEIPRRLRKVTALIVTEDGTLHVYDAGEPVAAYDLAQATVRDDGTTISTDEGTVRIRGPIDPYLLGWGIDGRTAAPERAAPLADLGATSGPRFESLVAIAWRGIRDPSGAQDLQLDARPSVHGGDWSVSVGPETAVEALPAFLRRAGDAGWELVSVVPTGSIEQNTASEALLGALNLRDTRFERTLLQTLYLRRRVPPDGSPPGA